MKKRFTGCFSIALILAGFLIFPNLSIGEEENMVVGEIIEISPNEQIIQVGNRNYIVTYVYIDDGITEEPVMGFFRNLEVGSIVEVHFIDKHDGFWKTEKVILFQGKKREDILKEKGEPKPKIQ